LLYAGQHPVFVVDAYTRRILDRHRVLPANTDYEEIRELFQRALNEPEMFAPSKPALSPECMVKPHRPSAMSCAKRTAVAQIFNDMHGLIVQTGKHFCFKSNPACDQCPLRSFLTKDAVPETTYNGQQTAR
jgi:endonuclease-3 related protein